MLSRRCSLFTNIVSYRKSLSCCGLMAQIEHLSNGVKNSFACYTAGIIVIGDEILKGQTPDTNSQFLTRRLFQLGVKVRKISVIPDEIDAISKEVSSFSNQFNFVITSGGIGPTHDDRTFEGVARAFGEDLQPHPEIVDACKLFFGTDNLKSPKLKLAFVPQSAKLLYGCDKISKKKLAFPLVSIRNVYIFPGVPHLMEKSFEALEDVFRNPQGQSFMHELYINQNEFFITGVINEANKRFGEEVIIGSYPTFHNNYFKVCLTLESESRSSLNECIEYFETSLKPYVLSSFDRDPMSSVVEKVYGLCKHPDRSFAVQVENSLKIIEDCFSNYDKDEIFIAFNGGKDCTALLHLVHAVVVKIFGQIPHINGLYLRKGQAFPEVEKFISKTIPRYHLTFCTFSGRIKDALTEFKNAHPDVKAIVMGTRLSDPHSSHLREFHPTDEGWPEFMRVNPILHWSYDYLWKFIRELSLPYCSLYDVGYTSLGSMENTHPNPALQKIDEKGAITYMQAYKLTDHSCERAGRN